MACLVVHMLGHVTSCVTEVRRTRQYGVTAMTSELYGLVSRGTAVDTSWAADQRIPRDTRLILRLF